MSRIFLAAVVSVALLFNFSRAQETAAEPKSASEDAAPPPPEPKVQTGSEPKRAVTDARKVTSPARRPKGASASAATPVPAATPPPKKQGFWARFFGRRPHPDRRAPAVRRVAPKNAPSPSPSKVPSRTKTATRPPGARSAPGADAENARRGPVVAKRREKPATQTGSEPRVAEREKSGATRPETSTERPPSPPANAETKAEPPARATPPPKSSKKPKREAVAGKPAPEPPAGSDPETVEQWKYNEAKRKALDDPGLQELKDKADNAADESEARKAMRAYNKGLFDRMRKLDPSIKERIDGTEAAVMKRLGESP